MGSPVHPRGSAVDAARRRLDQGLAVLGRLLPIARRTSRLVGTYTALVGIAAATIVVTLLVRFPPGSLAELLAYLVLAAVVASPTVVLWLFHRALAGTVRIPARLASMPEVAREHGTELAGLLAEAQRRRGRIRLASLPGDLWRAGRLLLAAHDDLPDYGAALSLISVPFLAGSLVAAIAGFWQIVLAPGVVAGAVLTTVV
jgi:hypothetical protein